MYTSSPKCALPWPRANKRAPRTASVGSTADQLAPPHSCMCSPFHFCPSSSSLLSSQAAPMQGTSQYSGMAHVKHTTGSGGSISKQKWQCVFRCPFKINCIHQSTDIPKLGQSCLLVVGLTNFNLWLERSFGESWRRKWFTHCGHGLFFKN